MRNNNCELTFNEILEDYIKNNNLTNKSFCELVEEKSGSLSTRQLSKYLNENAPDIKASNLKAISQVTKIPIDDLLNNTLEEKSCIAFYFNKLGLKSNSIAKLKKYKNSSQKGLFPPAKNSVYNISELDIINFFISDNDLFTTLKNEIIEFICESKRLEKEKSSLENNKSYFAKNDFQKALDEIESEKKQLLEFHKNKINDKTNIVISEFINSKVTSAKK